MGNILAAPSRSSNIGLLSKDGTLIYRYLSGKQYQYDNVTKTDGMTFVQKDDSIILFTQTVGGIIPVELEEKGDVIGVDHNEYVVLFKSKEDGRVSYLPTKPSTFRQGWYDIPDVDKYEAIPAERPDYVPAYNTHTTHLAMRNKKTHFLVFFKGGSYQQDATSFPVKTGTTTQYHGRGMLSTFIHETDPSRILTSFIDTGDERITYDEGKLDSPVKKLITGSQNIYILTEEGRLHSVGAKQFGLLGVPSNDRGDYNATSFGQIWTKPQRIKISKDRKVKDVFVVSSYTTNTAGLPDDAVFVVDENNDVYGFGHKSLLQTKYHMDYPTKLKDINLDELGELQGVYGVAMSPVVFFLGSEGAMFRFPKDRNNLTHEEQRYVKSILPGIYTESPQLIRPTIQAVLPKIC